MRLSNKQATLLVEILRATLSIANLLATYNTKTRQDLYDEIINQQSDEIVELTDYSKITAEEIWDNVNEPEETPTDSKASPDGS